jgi:hypothetical protein
MSATDGNRKRYGVARNRAVISSSPLLAEKSRPARLGSERAASWGS